MPGNSRKRALNAAINASISAGRLGSAITRRLRELTFRFRWQAPERTSRHAAKRSGIVLEQRAQTPRSASPQCAAFPRGCSPAERSCVAKTLGSSPSGRYSAGGISQHDERRAGSPGIPRATRVGGAGVASEPVEQRENAGVDAARRAALRAARKAEPRNGRRHEQDRHRHRGEDRGRDGDRDVGEQLARLLLDEQDRARRRAPSSASKPAPPARPRARRQPSPAIAPSLRGAAARCSRARRWCYPRSCRSRTRCRRARSR